MHSVSTGTDTAVARRPGCWTAWALSAAALGTAVMPGGALWAAPLFALAIAHWAWLAYGARAGRDAEAIHDARLTERILAVSRTAGSDLRALRADLRQVRILVHDAAVTLGDGFQGLSETMRREGAAAVGTAGTESIEVLVRSLQFEDVARQLLEYCDHQVAGLEACADDLAALLADATSHGRPTERESRLIAICERYLEDSRLWAARRERHITQTSVQAGKVELF